MGNKKKTSDEGGDECMKYYAFHKNESFITLYDAGSKRDCEAGIKHRIEVIEFMGEECGPEEYYVKCVDDLTHLEVDVVNSRKQIIWFEPDGEEKAIKEATNKLNKLLGGELKIINIKKE